MERIGGGLLKSIVTRNVKVNHDRYDICDYRRYIKILTFFYRPF